MNGVRVADHWSVPATSVPTTTRSNATKTDAAKPADPSPEASGWSGGRSATLVRDYLAARPDEDLGPTQVGKALGRSQGAVSNALARLEAAGEAGWLASHPAATASSPSGSSPAPAAPAPPRVHVHGGRTTPLVRERLPHSGVVVLARSPGPRQAPLRENLAGRPIARLDSHYPTSEGTTTPLR